MSMKHLDQVLAPAASDDLIDQLAKSVLDVRDHQHPRAGQGEDWHCLNLKSYMGERMGPVLVRLRAAEAQGKEAQVDAVAFRSLMFNVLQDLERGRFDDAEQALREALDS